MSIAVSVPTTAAPTGDRAQGGLPRKVAEDKERDREERERIREGRKVEQEIERERQRLRKEQVQFEQAIRQLEAQGDTDGAERLLSQPQAVLGEIEAVDFRARTLTAGHVYVIGRAPDRKMRTMQVGRGR